MRFATPNAKRGPGARPDLVPSSPSFDSASNDPQRSGRLQLPAALEHRLTVLEAEVADIRRCVVACTGERCTAACWLAEGEPA